MTLYQFAKLDREEQAVLWKMLQAEVDADELAKRPALVKKYYLAAMYHVMMGRTRRHVHKLVDRGDPAADPQCGGCRPADLGARFREEILDAVETRGVGPDAR